MASTEPAVGERVDRPADGLLPSLVRRRGLPLAPVTRVERVMRPRPPAVEPDDGLAAAAARMRTAGVGVLPVLQAGRLVGMITERHVLLAVADGLSSDMVRVASYMAAPCVVAPEAGAAEAAALMAEHRVRHLLVVCQGEVVGVLSASRLLREWGVPGELLGDEPDDALSNGRANR